MNASARDACHEVENNQKREAHPLPQRMTQLLTSQSLPKHSVKNLPSLN